MTDITDLIDQTSRRVADRQITAGKARALVLRRRYDTTVADVWDACTDPARMRRWFLAVSGDLRPGGHYQLADHAGGQILRCEPPALLRVTWEYPGHPTGEVELRLSPDTAGGTVFELEHALAVAEFPAEARGVGPGWEPAVYALDLYLSGRLPDALAAQWRRGEPPAGVMELIDQSARLWAALIAQAGEDAGGGTR